MAACWSHSISWFVWTFVVCSDLHSLQSTFTFINLTEPLLQAWEDHFSLCTNGKWLCGEGRWLAKVTQSEAEAGLKPWSFWFQCPRFHWLYRDYTYTYTGTSWRGGCVLAFWDATEDVIRSQCCLLPGFIKANHLGLPWGPSGENVSCQCRGWGFDPRPGKIPCAMEQPSHTL